MKISFQVVTFQWTFVHFRGVCFKVDFYVQTTPQVSTKHQVRVKIRPGRIETPKKKKLMLLMEEIRRISWGW